MRVREEYAMACRTIAAAAFLVLAAPPTASASVKFCAHYLGTYMDAGFGEDRWANNTLEKYARGARIKVKKDLDGDGVYEEPSEVLWDSYAGDAVGSGDPGAGCTASIAVAVNNGDYMVHVYSYGVVQGNTLESHDRATGTVYVTTDVVTVSGGAGTYGFTASVGGAFDEYNVYTAGAYAISIHAGGLSAALYDYRVGPPTGTTGCAAVSTQYCGGKIYIWGAVDEKFSIVHETSHRMMDDKTNGDMLSVNDCTYSHTGCPASSGGHSIRSKEYAGCAHNEGFAWFYAADVWNDDTESDCSLRYVISSPDETIDCENGAAYMESSCSSGGLAGYGVELDWLRMWWHFHTDAGTKPTFTDIAEICLAANFVSATSTHADLVAGVAAYASGTFSSRFASVTDYNGTNH